MIVPENPPGAGTALCEAAGAGLIVFVGAADDEVAFDVGAALGAFDAAGSGPLKAAILCVEVIRGGVMARTAPRPPTVPPAIKSARLMRTRSFHHGSDSLEHLGHQLLFLQRRQVAQGHRYRYLNQRFLAPAHAAT